jgi:hypothetical protein
LAVLAQSAALNPPVGAYEALHKISPAQKNKGLEQVLNKNMLGLILKVVSKKPEVEFVHYAL